MDETHRAREREAEEHALQVLERRNRAFRVLYDTVLEVEGAAEEEIFAILCRNLRKISNAATAALASYDPVSRTVTLEAVDVEGEDRRLSAEECLGETVSITAEIADDLKKVQIRDCVDHRMCLVEFFPNAVPKYTNGAKCYRLSCVREGELVAVGMIQLHPGQKLKMKDMIDTYLSTAGVILQRVYAVKSLRIEITERKRAEREIEERRRYLEGVLGAAPDAIVTLDARHRIVEWNPGAERLFGYSQEEVIGQNIDDLVTSPDAFEEAVGFTQMVLGGKDLPPVETIRYRKDGSPVDVIVAGSPILVGDELIGVVVVYTDITERKRAEEQLAYLATHDALTGVANRRHFFELAERELNRAQRYGQPVSAIMLDVDHFKKVNDTYGHAIGDQVLRAAAERCSENIRDIDILGRYGGEEFAIVLPATDLTVAQIVAERLRRCIADAPVPTDKGDLTVTISLGVASNAQGQDDEEDVAALLNRADAAMYAAKQAGRNRVAVID